MIETEEIEHLFEQSGLNGILAIRSLTLPDNYTPYAKLLLVPNRFRLQSIEIVSPKSKPRYLRLTYHSDTPDWLPSALASFENFVTHTKAGSRFDGDPIISVRALAILLSANT